MTTFHVMGNQLQAKVFVFDKDGLLFDSEPFWKALANVRVENLFRLTKDKEVCSRWLKLMGCSHSELLVLSVDPKGVLAIASPEEEVTVTATVLVDQMNLSWTEARSIARDVYRFSDAGLDLGKALSPMKGFPKIFDSLREKNIPYGIATSDTYERTVSSIELYDDARALEFIVTPKDVVKGKPDKEMLEKVADLCKIHTSELVMIGDAYVDVEMAANAGSIGIGVTKDPDMRVRMQSFTPYIIESLEQIVL